MLRVLSRTLISSGVPIFRNNAGLGMRWFPFPLKGISPAPICSSSQSSFSTLSWNVLLPWKNPGNNIDCMSCCGGQSQLTNYVPSRGMKVMGRVKRRCKDCQLVWKDGVLYNLCKTHPRHKQMLKQPYWENQRIITHTSSGCKRPW